MRRVLCIWLPHWPLQRLAAGRPELLEPGAAGERTWRAMVLYRDRGGRAAQVAVVSPQAAARGIRPGMPLAEALGMGIEEQGAKVAGRKSSAGREVGQARGAEESRQLTLGDLPAFAPPAAHAQQGAGLIVLPHDPAADRAALAELAEWCGQFSPIVGLEEADEPDCLLLDVTGLARLFGGERRLAEHVLRALVRRGFTARLALADTVVAAWALAKWGNEGRESRVEGRGSEGVPQGATAVFRPERMFNAGSTPHGSQSRGTQAVRSGLSIAPPGRSIAALARLPIAALRLVDDAAALLRELGIERVEQLLALPRGGLAARFGADVLRRVDEATGERAVVITSRRAPPVVEAAWEFDSPTDRRDALLAALERLLADIVGRLAPLCQGVGQFECRLTPQAGAEERFTVGLFRPSASARHLGELAELQLERLPLAEPIAALRVTVSAAAPLEARQRELGFEEEGDTPQVAPRTLSLHRGGVEGERQLAALLDRLASRLGRGGVLRARLLADAQPEYACRWEAWIDPAGRTAVAPRGASRRARGGTRSAAFSTGGLTPPARRGASRRPLRLARRPAEVAVTSLAPAGRPARFVLRGCEHRVRRCWGPERIETGWWRAAPARRDYYRVESDRGGWFWLFRRRRDGRWFWHGTFE